MVDHKKDLIWWIIKKFKGQLFYPAKKNKYKSKIFKFQDFIQRLKKIKMQNKKNWNTTER